jgi:hypothetical protein
LTLSITICIHPFGAVIMTIESVVEVIAADVVGATVAESIVEETTKGFFSSLISGAVEGVCENPLVATGVVVAATIAAATGYWFWKANVAEKEEMEAAACAAGKPC